MLPAEPSRRSRLAVAARHGAYLGLKWVTLIVGSVLVIVLTIAAGAAMYAVVFLGGVERVNDPEFRWNYLKLIGTCVGAYISSAAWGMILGATIAVAGELIRGRKSSK
jgi:hypothetical protein